MSTIANIQQQIADQLSAQSVFSFITVLTENSGDIVNEMAKALGPATSVGGKSGAFILVMTPDANANFKNLYGPFFDEIKVVIQVTVNVPVASDQNAGVGLLGLDICEAICNALAQFFPAAASSPLAVATPTIKLVARSDDETTHTVNFTTQGGIRTVPPQVTTPVILISMGLCDISIATSGAAIFYTLDGSNPSPLNPNATFWVGTEFTITSGQTVKARGWLAGYLASEIASATAP